MRKNKLKFPIFLLSSLLILLASCNSDNLVGKTWKLKRYQIEVKIDGKFEKINSGSDVGLLFKEIKFINGNEFNFMSEGITNDKKDITSLGGTGFYKRTSDELILEHQMQKKTVHYKVDEKQFVLVQDVQFDPSEPMKFVDKNNHELEITEARYICFYN